ncbi:MAG TPA: DNA cytosine methyltransferase [Longimicrobiales bacterium]|nr:DNA cytosine methyltransferase [Longimicrobiales bacterium]
MTAKGPCIPTISLFSGAGGLDLGFRSAGFDVRVAVESDPSACATLAANNPHLNGRIFSRALEEVSTRELLESLALADGEELGAVIGGPPCQPFCHAGPRLGLDDPRSRSLFEFCRVVREALPRVFVMENVPGLLHDTDIPNLISAELDPVATKYELSWDVLEASEFGAPQRRQRLFFVGWREAGSFRFPAPTHSAPDGPFARSAKPASTVREAFKGLPRPSTPSKLAKRVAQTIPARNEKWYGKK